MNDEKAFLTAILEQPDDDSKKLIYADWLEERGDARGEYLRLMTKVRRDRAITPDQRQRHKVLSDELAELRTQEVTALTARYAYADPSPDNPRRQHRIQELESQLLELSKQIHQDVPARLQELAATFDPAWLSVVSDPEIEGCGRQTNGDWRLRFEIVCDKTWVDLTPTKNQKVRHCGTCNKNVYFCDTLADAREHSQDEHCIAVDLGIIRRDGDLNPPSLFMGQPSKADLRESYEEDVDAVSQARLDARKKKKRTQKR